MARKLTQGVEVDKLDALVRDLGVRVRIWRSTIMPNMTSLESLDQDINEKISDYNMLDFDCRETIAMFQQQELVKQFEVLGTFHIDEVMATFLSGITLVPYTKVEVLDFQEDFTELIQRQIGTDIDRLKYSAACIIGVFTHDKVNQTVQRYHENADYVLSSTGDIKWIGAHRPADRQIYSVYYKHHPTYRATKAIHRDRFSQFNTRVESIKAPKKTVDGRTYVKMPETWILKRDYLVSRRDEATEVLPVNEYYDPNNPNDPFPLIISQTADTSVEEGEPLELQIEVQESSRPQTFQWYLGETGDETSPIVNATEATYFTGPLSVTTQFWVKVSNDLGSTNSATFTITVL